MKGTRAKESFGFLNCWLFWPFSLFSTLDKLVKTVNVVWWNVWKELLHIHHQKNIHHLLYTPTNWNLMPCGLFLLTYLSVSTLLCLQGAICWRNVTWLQTKHVLVLLKRQVPWGKLKGSLCTVAGAFTPVATRHARNTYRLRPQLAAHAIKGQWKYPSVHTQHLLQ